MRASTGERGSDNIGGLVPVGGGLCPRLGDDGSSVLAEAGRLREILAGMAFG